VALGATGTPTDDFTTLTNLIAISVQWDLYPATAVQLLDQL
jgi:hypothetical protein